MQHAHLREKYSPVLFLRINVGEVWALLFNTSRALVKKSVRIVPLKLNAACK